MSVSLLQLRDQIVLDADVKGDPLFGITRLNRIINLAQRYVQAQLNGLGFKKFETSMPVTLIAGTFVGQNVKKFGLNALTNILESPRSIIFIEVSDGTSYGMAYPVDANKFKDQVVNVYAQPTILDPAFTRLANLVLLTPSTITTATAYYYKVIKDLTDATISITGATYATGLVTVTATNHGLTTGDLITISGVVGMTDLNSTFMVTVTASNTFTVVLTTVQSYSSGGAITVYSQIPTEFEDFIIRKAVMDIGFDQGKIKDKANAMTELNNDLTQIFSKFYGTVQNENMNQQAQNAKLQ